MGGASWDADFDAAWNTLGSGIAWDAESGAVGEASGLGSAGSKKMRDTAEVRHR